MEKFIVTGMSCASCAAHVEKAVRCCAGVTSATVSLLTETMAVEYGAPATADAICDAVRAAGYGAEKVASGAHSGGSDAVAAASMNSPLHLKHSPIEHTLKRLVASALLLLPLLYISMAHSMWGAPLPQSLARNPLAIALLQMILAAAVMIVNQAFFISGFKSVSHGAPNMDTLVALGSGASFAYSVAVLFRMTAAATQASTAQTAMAAMSHDLYFEGAATILTLITVGKALEAHSKGQTTNALRALMRLASDTACVVRSGAESVIDAADVVVGDIFIVRPGEKVPVDGVIIEGNTSIDESALTGESMPVYKSEGAEVSTATLNQNGCITCRAVRVGEDTAISRIVNMVQDAAASKAPIARLADKAAAVFVPVVIALAAAVLCVWLAAGRGAGFALARAVSVLVISCPCALGLATPVAIMVGSGVGARYGILFKTAAGMEQIGRAQIAVLDKTGTVTEGRPRVTQVLCAKGVDKADLLRTAASLESKSSHPLAAAIMEEAKRSGVSADETDRFENVAGQGVAAFNRSHEIIGGNSEMLLSRGVDEKELSWLTVHGQMLSQAGMTPLYFARDRHPLGLIAVMDVPKASSAGAVMELRQLGLDVVMLTGDNEQTALQVAHQVGIERVGAELLPQGKAEAVARLRRGAHVAMVGDGINDAPALTQADIGVAIGAGTDVAIDAADVVLMRNDLMDVARAVQLSRSVLVNIKENLFWAFCYNVVCIPVAAGALIPAFGVALNPMMAALAMSLSSVCVVTNALRLNLFGKQMTAVRAQSASHVYGARSASNGGIGASNSMQAASMNTIKEAEGGSMKKVISIDGMMCQNCARHVNEALSAVSGVSAVEVNLEGKNATVTLAEDVADELLQAAVSKAGYKAVSVQVL